MAAMSGMNMAGSDGVLINMGCNADDDGVCHDDANTALWDSSHCHHGAEAQRLEPEKMEDISHWPALSPSALPL